MKLNTLYGILKERLENPKPDSYTAHLASSGEDEILKKVGEEAVEVILAAKAQGNPRLVEEISDLTYHVLVLMQVRGLTLEDIEVELEARHKR